MRSRSLLLDSDVMIDFLRGHPKAALLIQSKYDQIILSTIVVAELYSGIRNDTELNILDSLVGMFRVIPVTVEIARQAGLYTRDYHKSHGVGLADATVAATVELESADLATLNTKHYPMISGLKPAYLKK